jgi:hypothetical protein
MLEDDQTDSIPSDLVPLPTMPYSERPSELPLETEECRTAIWMAAGNITEAAKLIKVSSNRLRVFVKKSAYLTAEVQEAADRLVDIAEANVRDALLDREDPSRRDTMSRFVLSNIGKSRGWGTAAGPNVSVKNSVGGTIIVQWADGSTFGEDNSNTIEGEVIDDTPTSRVA